MQVGLYLCGDRDNVRVNVGTFLRFATVAMLAIACGNDVPKGTIVLSVGEESEAFSRAPVPTSLVVEAIARDGTATALTTAALPATTVDVGDVDVNRVAALRVTARDAEGTLRLRGLSLPIQLGAFESASFPVFVQRVDEMARMPSPLGDAREDPRIAMARARYIVVAGGSGDNAKTGSLYDLALLKSFAFPSALSRAPSSLAVTGGKLLVIDASGASVVELTEFTETSIDPPSGGTFADVAGGATIVGDNGVTYIVGATRARTSGDATARILRIDTDGSLSFATLAEPRLGASAAWSPRVGLIVAGGASTGSAVERLGAGATLSVAVPYPSRAVTGAGAVVREDGTLLLLGGITPDGASAPSEIFDLACTTACAASVAAEPFPEAITRVEAFTLPNASVLALGSTSDGKSVAFRLDRDDGADARALMTARAIAFRAERKGARGIRLYNGSIAIVGGAASIEAYAP
jgi:hypothetical protein